MSDKDWLWFYIFTINTITIPGMFTAMAIPIRPRA